MSRRVDLSNEALQQLREGTQEVLSANLGIEDYVELINTLLSADTIYDSFSNQLQEDQIMKVGYTAYYVFEDVNVTKVTLTAVGGCEGCCIESNLGWDEFGIDTATYKELFWYPFEVVRSVVRNEIYVNDLLGSPLFTIDSDEVDRCGIMSIKKRDLYDYISIQYGDTIEALTDIRGL